ncbi:energy transducer TonB [uncultured Pseudoteredinibacter sp.]|uniref:energy transducer TonB n=1 Tax=uncultured Pseudoteredinibacter sp. TaxID=1641701 RepID=UPI0026345983|nr:energy transducer TonB [uncultured Pseudoteredinibacter sp.]
MESLNYWPMLESSINIALGAIIAGVSTWVVMRQKDVYQDKLENGDRRVDILEAISTDVGQVNHIFAKYSALVIESYRFGDQWPQGRREELSQVNADLIKEFKKLADAETRLLMLGEKLMERSLRLYGAKIAHFRKEVFVGRQDIKEADIVSMKQDVATQREKFYDLLSKRYDRLIAA